MTETPKSSLPCILDVAEDLRAMIAMLGKCANPDCGCEFKRMGTGRIYTLHLSDPKRWGFPEQVKQKVVWLCAKCDHHKKVRFDHERCQILVVNRHEHLKRSA